MTYREKIIEILQMHTGERKMQIKKAKSIADALIANDVIVLNRGKWIKTPTGYINEVCSICGGWGNIDEKGCAMRTSYCPNCGAKMDGGVKDGKSD